jgi:hypothetical protein
MRRSVIAAVLASCLAVLAVPTQAAAEGVRREAIEHPRIVRAIHEIESAIRYLEAAPHDFGGHKAAALAASREAVQQLRQALLYRAAVDTRKGK